VIPGKRRASPLRYSARAVGSSGRITELAISVDLKKVIACVRSHHERSGERSWVWRLKDGRTVFELLAAVSNYAACA